MQQLLTFLVLLCALTLPALAQNTQHEVQAGETLYGISRQYGISVQQLQEYNPQTAEGLKKGMVLRIPAPLKNATETKKGKYETHQVKPGETLYSISRMYGIGVGDIEKANPGLETNGIAIGALLRIPVAAAEAAGTAQIPQPRDTLRFIFHQVEKGETAYSLSKKFELNLDSLYFYNPAAKKGLHIGQVLRFPRQEQPAETPTIALSQDEDPSSASTPVDTPNLDTNRLSEKLLFYKVKTGDSFYALKNRFNTSQEELQKLNPELKEGLKVDQYILIPRKGPTKELGWLEKLFTKVEEPKPVDATPEDRALKRQLNKQDSLRGSEIPKSLPVLEDTLRIDTNRPFKVGLMLPFYQVDSLQTDTGSYAQVPHKAHMALDFYNGFLLAADSIAGQGMQLTLKVNNTHNDLQAIRETLTEPDNQEFDLIVGPLYARNVHWVADHFREKGVPVVSPLSTEVEIEGRPNLIRAIPEAERKEAVIAQAINERYQQSRIIFVHQGSAEEQKQVIRIKSRLQSRRDTGFLSDVVFTEEMLKRNELHYYLSPRHEELFVMLSEEPVFMSDMISKLQSFNDTTLSVMCSHKTLELPTISYHYLESLQIAAPGINYIDYEHAATRNFIWKYRVTYQDEPNRFALQGYDLGLFFLEKLRKHGPYLLNALPESVASVHTNAGFSWQKTAEGGYVNQFMFLTGIRNLETVLLHTYPLEGSVTIQR